MNSYNAASLSFESYSGRNQNPEVVFHGSRFVYTNW